MKKRLSWALLAALLLLCLSGCGKKQATGALFLQAWREGQAASSQAATATPQPTPSATAGANESAQAAHSPAPQATVPPPAGATPTPKAVQTPAPTASAAPVTDTPATAGLPLPVLLAALGALLIAASMLLRQRKW